MVNQARCFLGAHDRLVERLQRQGSPLLRINPQEVNVHNPKAVEIALGALEALQSIAQQLEPS